MSETFEELKESMEAYPNELNKYIHQNARDSLMKMGRLDELRGVKPKLSEVKETKIEDTSRYKLLKKKTVRELKDIARKMGIIKYYDKNEDGLIKSIIEKE